MIAPPDEIRPLYRAIQLVGLMAIVIFIAGLVEFVTFEPPGQASGTTARIAGIYAYNATAGATSGPSRLRFGRDEEFAAIVDWASIPPTTVVAARWFDGFGEVVGAMGPAPAGMMASPIIPVTRSRELRSNLPGTYLFVVERISGGLPVEVLARRLVEVERK
ncbi:MAG: hypothetical protein NVS9B1_26000 [Candidatus Dormibacteraceae bacterium]